MTMTMTITDDMRMHKEFIPAVIKESFSEETPENIAIIQEYAEKKMEMERWEDLIDEAASVHHFLLEIYPFRDGLRAGKTGVIKLV